MAFELHAALLTITTWAERHRADVSAARERYDARTLPQAAPIELV